jgi:hypothetical protein
MCYRKKFDDDAANRADARDAERLQSVVPPVSRAFYVELSAQ